MTDQFHWKTSGANHHRMFTRDGACIGVVDPSNGYTYAVALLPHGMTASCGVRDIADGKYWVELFWRDLDALVRRVMPEPTVTAQEGLR